MNARERFLAYTDFANVDRPPRWEWSFRPDTTALWRAQGLPADVPQRTPWVEYFNLDRGAVWMEDILPTNAGLNTGPCPAYGDDIVERTGTYVVRRGPWGAIDRELGEGFHSIPQYLSFAVRDRSDFARFTKLLDPTDPARYPADWTRRKDLWRAREWPLFFHVHGWYGVLRELMGVEALSVSFYDQPELVEEVCEFWADFVIQVSARLLREVDVDYMLFWEDLAYKSGPLLSPEHFKRFFSPHYRRVVDFLRSHGVRRIMVDSDGNIDLLTPLWLDAGVTMLGPYEVAAGMDVAAVRRKYRDLVIIGGIDKREVAKGPRAIEVEVLRRVAPVKAAGGYLPTLDHSTIPELTLQDYRYYREFLAKVFEP